MKICYHCEICGADIDEIELAVVDEKKLGFDCLTGDERKAIISVDTLSDTMDVQSLCDACIKELGLDDVQDQATSFPVNGLNLLH
ncbi:anti-sigma-F factor Fin [Anaerosinus gibii]|uniref:DUF2757 family protein n=1 Tax=Selenobaculum gibii TaxID=3054208 RepID=A0A9Y2AGJ9_9FIRM|nr:anti-sigma-F factor Fin [Selenobaculum gbiensis]WIW71320.1 DUF2757 family protein [Selenobaculum gbiensis]